MKRRMLVCGLSLLWLGCGGGDDPSGTGGGGGAAEADPDADACEHLEGGPFADLDAGADRSGAPDASASHTAHRIVLPDDGMGSFAGYVSLTVDEATEVLLYLDAPAPLSVEDSGGDELMLELPAGCPGDGCAEGCALVGHEAAVDVGVVGTYYLRLGPASESNVTLVHFESSHGHE